MPSLPPSHRTRAFHVDEHSSSTAKTSHFARDARYAGCWKTRPHPLLLSLPTVLLSLSLHLLACASAAFPRCSRGSTARWESRERLAGRHIGEIFSRIPPVIAGLSASMCIFTLTGISTWLAPAARVIHSCRALAHARGVTRDENEDLIGGSGIPRLAEVAP